MTAGRALRLTGFLLLAAGPLAGQGRETGGQVNAGYPIPLAEFDDATSGSFTWGAGFRYSPFEKPYSIRFDIQNSRFNIDNQVIIDAFDGQDGYSRTWEFVLSGEIGIPNDRPFRIYAIGGGGAFNRYSAVTEPELVSGCYWDPWWGYVCGSGVADEIIVKQDKWGFGLQGGAGLSYRFQNNITIFAEGIYNFMFTGGDQNPTDSEQTSVDTKWLPLRFGLRF
jgi:opacity protein-like surface antigen